MKAVDIKAVRLQKYPEWIILIVTTDGHERVNIMPAGWSMFTSGDPPMYAISVGHTRYTHELIRKNREFTLAIPGPGMGNAIRFCGTHSGRHLDKIHATGIQLQKANQVASPLVTGALVNMECRLATQVDSGDHTIFVGEIIATYVQEEISARLLNFGPGLYAAARTIPDTEFHF